MGSIIEQNGIDSKQCGPVAYKNVSTAGLKLNVNSAPKPRFSAELRWVIVITALGAIMALLDSTVVNVALHSLATSFSTSLVTIQWVVAAYLLALGGITPATGWAARRFGSRRLYLVAITAFAATSLLCGLATSAAELIGFRAVQGVAGGILASVGQILLVQRAGPRNLARALGAVGTPMLLAPILGPVIGGLLLVYASWHWIFFINIPIALVTLLVGRRFLPADQPGQAARLDLAGLAMIGLGMTGVIYALAQIGVTGSAMSVSVLLPLAGGLGLTAAFVIRALRIAFPLLDVRLYRSLGYSAAALTTFASGAAVLGGMILLPLYFQTVRGDSAVTAGLLLMPSGVGAGLGMFLSGRVTDKIGAGRCAGAGGIILIALTVPLAFLTAGSSYLTISLVTAFRGIGIGLITMPAMTAAFRAIGPAHLNDAAPQLNMLQRIGGSVGTAAFAVILQAHLHPSAGRPGGQATAYDAAFWSVLGATVVATLPTILIAISEKRSSSRVEAGRSASLPDGLQAGDEA
jgi:EmrB/QacA subfamily drug resistance transporter